MSLRSTGSWFPLPALVGVVVLFPLALLRTPASATAAPRLSPFRAFAAPAPFPRLTVLAAPAPATPAPWHAAAHIVSNFEISAIFRFWWLTAILTLCRTFFLCACWCDVLSVDVSSLHQC